jgi:hypothetical protein
MCRAVDNAFICRQLLAGLRLDEFGALAIEKE